jgi:peptidoglycan/LPS O-acetylase OafA/YrhL
VLLVAALWPLAQLHPGPMLFGNGELGADFVAALLEAFGRQAAQFNAGQFAAAEAFVTACGMLGVCAALTAQTRPHAPRLRMLALLLAAALAAKAIAYGHEFGPERALSWLTPGAVAGLAAGLLAATAAATAASVRAVATLAVAALLLLAVAVNSVPPNPYHAHWLAAWRPGRLRDVAAATEWLARAWPYAMLVALLWPRRPAAGAVRPARRPS